MAGIADLAATAAAIPAPALASLSDDAVLAGQRILATVRRRVDALAAEYAAEIARRSTREHGHEGLAQRLGARTAAGLVQRLTGSSAREAGELVAAVAAPGPLCDGVRGGELSVGQAAAIRGALEGLDAATSDSAAATLAGSSLGLTLEQTRAQARELRDELDAAGILEREEERRERRYLRLFPQPDGMTRLVGLLDPESAARVTAVVDAATSPRRGGPRFVDPAALARAEEIVSDPRTTEQLAVDAVVDVLRAGLAADPDTVPGPTGAPVQILATTATARIAGQSCAVSTQTADRYACTEGIESIAIDRRGQVIDLGRQQRRFNRAQRRALAARDGGCRAPGCDRPASWTEAHHIIPWSEGGRTDLADGILLCRFHHLLLHNNGWRIEREGGEYWMIPPPSIDPARRRIRMPTKNPLVRRLIA